MFRSLVEGRTTNGTLEKWKRDHDEYVSRVRRLTFVDVDDDDDGGVLEEERAGP